MAGRGWTLSIAADDRTGALEVAGMCADACGEPVRVHVHAARAVSVRHLEHGGEPRVRVLDLGTRHLAPADAAAIARRTGSPVGQHLSSAVLAHKIDSTLRGNWAAEVVARGLAAERRVLVVPAFPAMGRTCSDGVVRVHGVPVAEGAAGTDARGPARSSRPAELLADAGAGRVAELTVHDPAVLHGWLRGDLHPQARVAVCDAGSDDDLRTIARCWSSWTSDVMFAGTAASIAEAARALASGPSTSATAAPNLELPALVICGSLHPVARAQVGSLADVGAQHVDVGATDLPDLRGGAGVVVLTGSAPAVLPVSDDDARRAAHALAELARAALGQRDWRSVVIIGGDTAAALLGDGPIDVGGTVGTGMPWFRMPGGGPIVVTKAGGFGVASTLTDLLLERTR